MFSDLSKVEYYYYSDREQGMDLEMCFNIHNVTLVDDRVTS